MRIVIFIIQNIMKYQQISLRAMEPEDLELFYEWENNSSYWVISNTIAPFSKFTLKRYLKNSHKNIYETGQLRLMIDQIDEKVTIGTIDIFDFDPFHKRAGLGILIADEAYRRKGYGSMSLKCLTDYCFKTLQLHQLYCNILANNVKVWICLKNWDLYNAVLKRTGSRHPMDILTNIFFSLLMNRKG